MAGIRTRAVRDGDHWVINGSKMFLTNAATADWLCLLAVTDPEAGYGEQEIDDGRERSSIIPGSR